MKKIFVFLAILLTLHMLGQSGCFGSDETNEAPIEVNSALGKDAPIEVKKELPGKDAPIEVNNDLNKDAPIKVHEALNSGQNNKFLTSDFAPIKGVIQSFAIVIVLIAMFFVFLKWRYGGSFRGLKSNKKRHIQVIEHSMLGPKRAIYLVKVMDKLLVVGATGEGMSLLSEMDDAEKSELPGDLNTPPDEGFSILLQKKDTGKDSAN